MNDVSSRAADKPAKSEFVARLAPAVVYLLAIVVLFAIVIQVGL